MGNGQVPQPIVELAYVPKGSTQNLPVVSMKISEELFNQMAERIRLYEHMERKLGRIEDKTRYYNFEGDHYFLRNGDVQIGRAVTSDNRKRFKMIRVFTNSMEEARNLEKEIGFV